MAGSLKRFRPLFCAFFEPIRKFTCPVSTAADHKARRYPARIVGIDDVAQDTRILQVALENKGRMAFDAGQYALLGLDETAGELAADADIRPFSIASTPQEPLLEFHIRSTGQGLSDYLVHRASLGTAVTVEGPFGTSHWRPSPRPLMALAGGLGIAPLKAILEAHLAQAGSPPCHLYWGVRSADQLYLDLSFRGLAQRYPRFFYIPVLSDMSEDTPYRTGFISEAVTADFDTLSGFDIYMAGPPPMVAATLPALLHAGADKDHIYSDAWSTTKEQE
jgi:naphthalene 1,2-dioxygenase ferredoxin reductase component